MTGQRKIEIALLIIRLTAAAFLGVWASLKFYRPEWMVNVFQNTYKLNWVTQDFAFAVGTLQMLVVLAFVSGFKRTFFYGLVMLMSAAGVTGTLFNGALLNFTKYPSNLLWTSVPTLGALIALFILRDLDNLFSVSGRKK